MTTIVNEDGTRSHIDSETVFKSTDTSRWWLDDVRVSDAARQLLENYSGLAPEEVQPHAEQVRKNAFRKWPYPCIGMGSHLEFTTAKHAQYQNILERLKSGQTFLDAGCCFGQDIRRLIQDGAPLPGNLYGVDLEADFFALGKELFRDADTLGSHFLACDLTAASPPAVDKLRGQIDIVSAQNVLHLFRLDESKAVIKNLVALGKPKPGTLICGRQVGAKNGREERGMAPGSSMFLQNEETWREHWKDVMNETGTKWDVTFKEATPSSNMVKQSWWEGDLIVFHWSATRLE